MKAYQTILLPVGAALALPLIAPNFALAQDGVQSHNRINILEDRIAFLEEELRASGRTSPSKLAAAPSPRPPVAPAISTETVQAYQHVVTRGESLSAIATRYKTTVAHLVDLNRLHNESRIIVGQKLLVPAANSASLHSPAHVVRLPASQVPEPAPAQTRGPVSNQPKYLVKEGDTLASISRQTGHSIEMIRRANGLADADYIQIDQVLTMPGHGSPVVPAPKPVSQRQVAVTPEAPKPKPSVERPQPRAPREIAASPPKPAPKEQKSAPAAEDGSNFMTYTIRRDDTLDSIAATFGWTVSALRARNGFNAQKKAEVGQRIEVPTDGIFVSR